MLTGNATAVEINNNSTYINLVNSKEWSGSAIWFSEQQDIAWGYLLHLRLVLCGVCDVHLHNKHACVHLPSRPYSSSIAADVNTNRNRFDVKYI